jgi:hypothetical protein
MTTFEIFAARDGDTYRDTVGAADQEEAESKAREQLAEAWRMTDELYLARKEGDESAFDAELDGFSVEPCYTPPAPRTDAERVERALALLIEARALLKTADNKRTAARVEAAISSCRGARRIQGYRTTRALNGEARP